MFHRLAAAKVCAEVRQKTFQMPAPFAIILLAAGASTRLGQPKQFMSYNNSTLLDISLDAALQSAAQKVVLVLGAVDTTGISNPKLAIASNSHWQSGMASSIRCGLSALAADKSVDAGGVIIMACDQPFITSALLDNLVTLQQETGKKMVASAYAGTMGIPAFFHRDLFPELLALEGEGGAKKLLAAHGEAVATLDFSLGAVDIDTPEDYEKLKRVE